MLHAIFSSKRVVHIANRSHQLLHQTDMNYATSNISRVNEDYNNDDRDTIVRTRCAAKHSARLHKDTCVCVPNVFMLHLCSFFSGLPSNKHQKRS